MPLRLAIDKNNVKLERLLLIVLPIVQFTHITDFMLMMPLGPQLMRAFAMGTHAFATAVSAYTFSASIFGLLGAFFMDRFDRKRALLFLYAGFAAGTLGCALAPTYILLLCARIVAGAFGGMLSALCLSIVADAFGEERRGMAMGVMMSAFSLASVLGVPLGLFLANLWGWHAPFLFLAGLCLLVWLWAAFMLPPLRAHLRTDAVADKPWLIFEIVAKSANQRWALAFMVFIMFAGFSVIPFISPYLVANAGMAEQALPLLYLIGGAFVFFTSQAIGRLSDRYGKPRMFRIITVISLLPLLLVTNMGRMPLWFILASTTIFFIFVSGRIVPAMAMISATVEPRHRGRFMSLVSSVQQLGSGCAAQTAGMIIVSGADGRFLHYNWVGWLAVASSVICIGISTRIKTLAAA